jgi:hypothetical protein
VQRHPGVIRWFRFGSLAFVATGCGSSSSTPAPTSGDGAPVLSGEYDSDTGDRQSITFEDATHYSFVWRTCAAGAGLCTEEGTYALNDRRDTLTFTNAATGASTSIPFAVAGVEDPASAGVAPLADPAPPIGNASLVSAGNVTGGAPPILTSTATIIARFLISLEPKQDMYTRTPLGSMGIRG